MVALTPQHASKHAEVLGEDRHACAKLDLPAFQIPATGKTSILGCIGEFTINSWVIFARWKFSAVVRGKATVSEVVPT